MAHTKFTENDQQQLYLTDAFGRIALAETITGTRLSLQMQTPHGKQRLGRWLQDMGLDNNSLIDAIVQAVLFEESTVTLHDTPASMVSGVRESEAGACMSGNFPCLPNKAAVHPYEAYDPMYGWRLLTLHHPSYNNHTRVLVNGTQYVRIYSHSKHTMAMWMAKEGYEQIMDWSGKKLRLISALDVHGNTVFNLPYLDGDAPYVTLDLNNITVGTITKGKTRSKDKHSVSAKNSNGRAVSNMPRQCSCGALTHDIYEHNGAFVCASCVDKHGLAITFSGKLLPVEDTVQGVNYYGDTVITLARDEAVTLHNGEIRQRDHCRETPDGWAYRGSTTFAYNILRFVDKMFAMEDPHTGLAIDKRHPPLDTAIVWNNGNAIEDIMTQLLTGKVLTAEQARDTVYCIRRA